MPDEQWEAERATELLRAPSYIKAYEDLAFLKRDDLRPVRLQLELLKPTLLLDEQGVHSTIVVFGSTRVLPRPKAIQRLEQAERDLEADPSDPDLQQAVAVARRVLAKAHYYDEAMKFARIVSSSCQTSGECDYVIVTGGGPGIMEAANRGAFEVGGKSVGLNITLPHEQAPNAYVTPELCFHFHYFALRKMHFLMRAKAMVAFPGGFGTCDELFETLTLAQTLKIDPFPILLFGREFWEQAVNFRFLVDEGVISRRDLELFQFVESAEEAWQRIAHFYANVRREGGEHPEQMKTGRP